MRSAEEWAKNVARECNRRDNHPANLPSLFMCPGCAEVFARAYARECLMKDREKVAGMIDRMEWQGDGSLDSIVKSIRDLPMDTP